MIGGVQREDTIWWPRDDGDYSVWRTQLDEMVAAHCNNPNELMSGQSVSGDAASRGLFSAFTRTSGLDGLVQTFQEESVGPYIGAKAGYIVFIAFGVLVFIESIVLAFALFQKFRRCFRKCGGACTDRPREVPGDATKRAGLSLLSWIAILASIALAIVMFVYSSHLSKGTTAMECDFWLSMRGYFFGTEALQSDGRVVSDWVGTVPQWNEMRQLAYLVNPESCQLCGAIGGEFEAGLVQTLLSSSARVTGDAYKGMYLAAALHLALAFGGGNMLQSIGDADGNYLVHWNSETASGEQAPVVGRSPLRANFLSLFCVMLLRYVANLEETTTQGIALFQASLGHYLGQSSAMLVEAYETATTGIASINDVDYVMSQILIIWEKLSGSLKSGLIAVLALSIIQGIFAVLLVCFGCYAVWKLGHASKQGLPLSRGWLKAVGGFYVFLVVLAGLNFLLTSIYFTVGSVGSDVCEFIDTVVFERGDWGVLPEAILEDTPTGRTSIPTVFDACLRRSGDGDIAASLGLRLLLNRLSQGVSQTGGVLTTTLNTQLDLDLRALKAAQISVMASDSSKMLYGSAPSIGIAQTAHRLAPEVPMAMPMPEGLDLVSTRLMNAPIPKLGLMSVMAVVQGPWEIFSVLPVLTETFAQLAVTINSLDTAVSFLNRMAAEHAADFSSFCSPYLQKMDLCQGGDAGDVYQLDGRFGGLVGDPSGEWFQTGSGVPVPASNPFDDPRFQDFLKAVGGEEEDDQTEESLQNLLGVIQQVGYILNMDFVMLMPLFRFDRGIMSDELMGQIIAAVPEFAPEGGLEDPDILASATMLDAFKVALPEIQCTLPSGVTGPPVTDEDWAECTLGDAIAAYEQVATELGTTLMEGFTTATTAMFDFVDTHSIGRFNELLAHANHGLESFNCQAVGTSIQAGVQTALCEVVMPAVTSLAFGSLFLSLFFGIAAFVAWKAFHYYRDLEACSEAMDRSAMKAVVDGPQS